MSEEIGLLENQLFTEKIDHLDKEYLKELLRNFKEGFDNTASLIALPYILLSKGNIKERRMQLYIIELIKQKLDDSSTTKEEIPKKVYPSIVEEKSELMEEAYDEIEELKKNDATVGNSINLINYHSLTYSWAIFESVLKDLWIETLNRYPNLFFHNVLNKTNEISNITGIEGKQISLSLLSKYGFNVSSHLGTILSEKYDFTSVRGIRNSFEDLFGSKISFSFLDNDQLNQLEILRHNIVHKGGIIDEHYLKRSSREEEVIGNKLSVTLEEVNKLTSVAMNQCIRIFSQINDYLNKKEA